MDEENESKLVRSEFPLKQRNLSWLDLVLVLGGVASIYVLLTYGTIKLMGIWPYEERGLIYLNAFVTQLSLRIRGSESAW